MDYKWRGCRAGLAALLLIGGIGTGCAQALPNNSVNSAAAAAQGVSAAAVQDQQTAAPAQPLPASPTVALTPDEAKQNAAGNVAELQKMIRGSELTELRTTYNGAMSRRQLKVGTAGAA